jgi:DNA recombination protein RmuC
LDLALILLIFLVGVIIGATLAWVFVFKARLSKLNQSLAMEQKDKEVLLIEQGKVAERLQAFNSLEIKLKDTFDALSAEALKNNNEAFISLAKSQLEKYQEGAKHDLELRQKSISDLVKPITDGLTSVDQKVKDLDKTQTETKTVFDQQVKNLINEHTNLQKETQNLVRALRAPAIRGRWGEVQLRNVVEMAGMVEYCDFSEQESTTTESGRIRPDMTIRLPGGRNVVVDSKAPLEAYLDSIETSDERIRSEKLQEHARQVRTHVKKLSEKEYWREAASSPEFVVLFLPGEMFFSAALQQDPELIEFGARQKIIIATPTTLIALLRAVAYGWTSEALSKNAEEISNLGKRLYARIRAFAEHMTSVGTSLNKAIDYYNKAIGSLETSVLPPARTLKELAVSPDKDIDTFEPIELMPRSIQSSELLSPEDSLGLGISPVES